MPPLPKALPEARGGLFAVAFLLSAPAAIAADPAFPAEQITFFEKNVRPLLAENCLSCHGPEKQKNGLRLDSRDAVLRGSEYGKVVVPGDPENSTLIKAVRHAAGPEPMPPKKPQLSSNQIDALARWIQQGLPWPKEAVASGESKPKWQEHWAFQKVRQPEVPAIADPKFRGRNAVDAFVAAKLQTAKLEFAPPADPATLCRRLYVDLTGLPPTFEQVQAFVNDQSPGATEKLIDGLLNSPRYGERWARHWLDLARYSDTEGYRAGGVDIRYPHAYTYRDWVVKALNADMPYDQFITHQLAADRLPENDKANLAALAFLTINDSFLGDRALQIDDRIDVVGRGLLGLTVGCARCHDHKYDPIAGKDYYAFYSIFNSSETPGELPIIGQPANQAAAEQFRKKVADIESKKQAFRLEVLDDLRKPERLAQYLLFAQAHREDAGAPFSGAAGKAQLRDRIASKWRDFLKQFALAAKPHPVMLAWNEFSKLPADKFGERAGEIAQRLAQPGAGMNPVVRNELAKRPAPKDMNEVAALYAGVFVACMAGREPDNDDWKQVRSLLANPMSPMTLTAGEIERFFTRKDHEHMTQLDNSIKKLELTEEGAPLRAMVLNDTPQPRDVRVFIRGNPSRPGEPAPRAYLSMFGGQKFTEGSGRLDLARMIASRDNPLTARVIANRLWMDHFGRPLVSQPSDFGVQTPKPEQLALLDYLAATLMENGWSLKKLHKLILNSRTYQQSSASTPEKETKDAENNLLARFNRQRLDYESMRDALLAASRTLDVSRMGGHSVPLESAEAETRRSVYLFVDRYEQPTVPLMFDFANPDRHSPQRSNTTVPQQALFLMNSPFMRKQSEKIAAEIPVEGSAIDSQSVKALYRRVLSRDPKPEEVELAQRFAGDAEALQQEGAAFAWRYGSAQVKKDESGRAGVGDFTEFKFFKKQGNGHVWSPGEKVPDPKWHYCFWGSEHGHAGSDNTAPVAQWTAPFDAEIRISGELKRPSEAGDGVRGWIVSSRAGGVLDLHVAPKAAAKMAVAKLAVKKGDVLTFAVTSEGDTNSDSFHWTPVIERLGGDGRATLLTDAARDFCGPDHWPLNRARPQSVLSQLAQVLLMSNEFQFVD